MAGSDEWKTATPGDGLLKGKWWETFNDPQLNELEERVSAANFTVKQMEAQFRASRALVLGARANYYPTIGASPSIGVTGVGGNGTRLSGATTGSFSLPFSATWVPDLWGRVRLAVEAANANAQVTAADLENARLTLQATLAVDYFNLLGTDMEIALLQDTIKAYETYLTLTQNRYAGGVAARSDVTLAQTQLFTTQANTTDLMVARNQMEHAIAVITGRAPAEFSIAAGKIAGPPPAIPVALPSALLERRPDIAAQERLIAAANANIGLAEAAYYPTLSLSASASLTNTSLANLFTWASRVWSVGPTLSQTLFDFGRRHAAIENVEANYDAAVAAYRETVLTAFQQVEDNLSTLRVLAQESEQQASAVEAANTSLTLETDRYKAGTDTYLNVILTQTIALNDQRAQVTLLQRRMAAAVDLIVALGGGWEASDLPTPDQIRSNGLGEPANGQRVAQPVTH
jgi:NodT family efflux transporter outer membrane factor (OMF) lipoprotein